MTQIDKIENKIRELVGGTRDLVFGCKIIVKNYSELDNGIFISNGSYKTETGFRLFDTKKQDEYIIEIIGRDLTLSDLLLAIGEQDIQIKPFAFYQLHFIFNDDGFIANAFYSLKLSLQDNLIENKELVGLLVKVLEIE